MNPLKTNEDGFFSQVYEVTRSVPFGRVTTYGAIARFLGSTGSARMVGWALNNSHSQADFIPAHRVVNRNGMLSGKHHFPGKYVMEELLESEGVRVENDLVVDFETLFWDPSLFCNKRKTGKI
jgi:methylated-DNA-protein-cysteine methyltransferase related protein